MDCRRDLLSLPASRYVRLRLTKACKSQKQPDAESDAALLARFARLRDQRAFAELMSRHGPLVMGVCTRMLRQRQDAEDALQAVFVTLSARARALRRVRSLSGWLHNVAVRVSLNLIKMNRRRAQRLNKARNDKPALDEHCHPELRELLDEELTSLPARYREAVVLCDLQGYTRDEAGRKLAVPAGTVGTWVARGRKLLRDRLVRRGVTIGAGGIAAALSRMAEASPRVTGELAEQAFRHAELFLAGKSASALPATAKISSLAQGVLHAMFLTRLSRTVCIVALAAALVLGASPLSTLIGGRSDVFAQEFKPFLDDFSDQSTTDGSPVTWIPLPGFNTGTFDATSGDYVVTQPPDGWPQVATAETAPLSVTSIRAQVRELQGNGAIALTARGNNNAPTGYQAGIFPGVLYMDRINAPFDNTELAAKATALNPSLEDIWLQFDVVGSRLDLFVWRAGEEKPATPSLSATDSTFATGVVGILIDSPSSHSVAFRSIQVSNVPIPEPSSAVLGSLGFIALAGPVFRTRLNRVRRGGSHHRT